MDGALRRGKTLALISKKARLLLMLARGQALGGCSSPLRGQT